MRERQAWRETVWPGFVGSCDDVQTDPDGSRWVSVPARVARPSADTMSERRYEVYTMRRTSSRTVYAIYDNLRTQPVCKAGTDEPFTFTDKRRAQDAVRELESV